MKKALQSPSAFSETILLKQYKLKTKNVARINSGMEKTQYKNNCMADILIRGISDYLAKVLKPETSSKKQPVIA